MGISVDIKKRLDGFFLDISFSSKASRIGILGASGCGKSMTLKCIAGIETPDEGRIEAGGRIFYDSSARISWKPRKRNAGYLFQNYALFPTMTVEKNIGAGLRGGKREKAERVKEMVDKFQLNGLEKRFPAELSGGQQQRTALARILAYEPDIILLDEPFSALDMYLKDQLQRELMEMLKDYPGTVLLVSHSRDEIYRFSQEIFVMDQGKIAAGGTRKAIFENPVSKAAARLTGCKNFSRIRRIDVHTALALDWEIVLHTAGAIPEDALWIGYRAHDFIPEWRKGEEEKEKTPGENRIPFRLESAAELPFEQNYYIKAKEIVCWFVQRERMEMIREKGLPDYLRLDEKKMLFLK